MSFALSAIAVAFAVGFAMKRAGLCTYAAAEDIVQHGDPGRLLVFVGATAWAALVVVPLNWLFPGLFALSDSHGLWLTALLGGLVMGLGAHLNRGCMFGTFVQLVSGNLTYLGTLAGISLGVILVDQLLGLVAPALNRTSALVGPGAAAALWLTPLGLFALAMLVRPAVIERLWARSETAVATVLVAGIGGGTLYVAVAGWDYASVVAGTTRVALDARVSGLTLLAASCTLAQIVGGIVAALSSGSFRLQWPRSRPLIGNILRGTLMGGAAAMVPGGNDGMLLTGIPSLAPHSIISFSFIVIAMLALVYLLHRRPVKQTQPE